jgi:FkbM family methyltransferase
MTKDPLQTILEIINHSLNQHPTLAPQIQALAGISQGKGYTPTIAQEFDSVSNFFSIPPKLIVDIGGNVGDYTHEIRTKFKEAEIHIFEPSSFNINVLNDRFKQDQSIKVVPFAVSDNTGNAVLHSDHEGSGIGSLIKRRLDHFNIELNHSNSVSTIRFVDYWRKELDKRRIDFVKIDVEGSEFAVLKSFEEALRSTFLIQFEFGGTQIDSRTFFQDFWYLFNDFDFSIFRLCPEPQKLFPINKYSEDLEDFHFQNFIAKNNRLNLF